MSIRVLKLITGEQIVGEVRDLKDDTGTDFFGVQHQTDYRRVNGLAKPFFHRGFLILRIITTPIMIQARHTIVQMLVAAVYKIPRSVIYRILEMRKWPSWPSGNIARPTI